MEISRHKIKGGDNQIGHHLPGWGGVLLGKLNKRKLIISFENCLRTLGTRKNHQTLDQEIAYAAERVNNQI
jgi:hypothetical protein